jgi:hypothetical protein
MPGSAVRQPSAGIFQPNRAVGVRRHGHHGQAAVVQHATDTDGPAQIMRIDRWRIIRSVAKLARTRRSLRRAAAGPSREATMARQAVAVLVPGCRWTARPECAQRPRPGLAAGTRPGRRTPRPADDHSHRGPVRAQAAPRRRARTGAVPVIIGSRPSPASPSSPPAPPARACDANPLAGFGSEASKDQHYVLDAAHTTKGMTAQ